MSVSAGITVPGMPALSWLNSRDDANVPGVAINNTGNPGGAGGTAGVQATHITENKYTVGGGYTFGPGMTFRGAVAYVTAKSNGAEGYDTASTAAANGAIPENKQTQVTIGTDIKF